MSTLTTLIGNYDLSKIPQPEKDAAIAEVEEYFGLTHEAAATNLDISEQEHPEKDAAWHQVDAKNKFKHSLRHKIGAAVDAIWGGVEPIAAQLVADVLAHAKTDATAGVDNGAPTPETSFPLGDASTGGAG